MPYIKCMYIVKCVYINRNSKNKQLQNRTTALEAKLLEARQCCQEVEEQLTDQTAALRAVEQEVCGKACLS